MATTAQDPAERVKEYGQGKSALSDEERDGLNSRPISRNFNNYPPIPTPSRRLSFFVVGAVVVAACSAAAFGAFRNYELSARLATAERELRGYADQLNRKAPAGSSPLVIHSVSYNSTNTELYTIVTQGSTFCRLPVKSPDEKHNLYWTAGIEEVAVEKLGTAAYFCADPKAFNGIGSESTG